MQPIEVARLSIYEAKFNHCFKAIANQCHNNQMNFILIIFNECDKKDII